MAKQLNISFKDNDTERDLYLWIKSKLNPGTYAKELLYSEYLAEKNGLTKTFAQVEQVAVSQKADEVEEESTQFEASEFSFQ